MSGADIPYQLRPNKYVDREIFFDCVRRAIGFEAPENFVYMSMGGKHLVDHHSIHVSLGICRLFSFDMDQHTVKRQEFNKPYGFIRCENLTSGKFVDEFENIASSFEGDPRFIIWLDYTNHIERPQQLGELQTLLGNLSPGDIVKITVNADPRRFSAGRAKWPKHIKTMNEYRRMKFLEQMGDFCGNVVEADMSEENLPKALARCVASSVQKVVWAHDNCVARPLNVQSYSDGTPMLSCTCIVLNRGDADDFFRASSIERWALRSVDWEDVHTINVPDLSLKERTFVDSLVAEKPVAEIAASLGFEFEGGPDETYAQISSYIKHARFYPSFKRVDA